MATWYNGKWPNEVEERARIKAKELVKTYKTVDEINRFLIDNIDDVTYFDEDNETTSAARVLILRSGDSYGFCNAMIMLLEEIGVHGEPIIFKETRKLTGVIANGKIYAPFVQKNLERRYGVELGEKYNNWISKHGYEKPAEFVRPEI